MDPHVGEGHTALDEKIELFGVVVSGHDVPRFLASFGRQSPRCSVCNSNSWVPALSPPGSGEYLTLSTAKDDGTRGGHHLPSFALTCETCGLYKLFSAYQLAMWVKGNPAHE